MNEVLNRTGLYLDWPRSSAGYWHGVGRMITLPNSKPTSNF